MTLQTLWIEGFRNLQSTEIQWHPETNLILGPNAAGKTGLLESIHFLARFESFRTRQIGNLIRQGGDFFRLVGRIGGSAAEAHVLGMECHASGQRRIRLDGEEVRRRSTLAELLPLQLLNQEVHLLIEGGPERRRRFLDWGVFHVEPAYRKLLSRYHRLLRQRNAALRQGLGEREVRAWDPELSQAAGDLDRCREDYLARLEPVLQAQSASLLGAAAISLAYRRGWPAGELLEHQLALQFPGDRERGYTYSGPHRADLGIQVDGQQARDRLSRGQQKMLASGLVLAQLQLFCEHARRKALVLVDDLPSELDSVHRQRLFRQLMELPVQRFITAISAESLPGLPVERAVFHVKHGAFDKVVYS